MTACGFRFGLTALPLLIGIVTLAAAADPQPPAAVVTSDAEVIAHGRRLFAQHCQACHGPEAVGEDPATPLGGWSARLGPLAPALNGSGHSWHHSPDYLFTIIREGSRVKGSRMQGWGRRLSDRDILAVVAYFQSLWPPYLRSAYTERYLYRLRPVGDKTR